MLIISVAFDEITTAKCKPSENYDMKRLETQTGDRNPPNRASN